MRRWTLSALTVAILTLVGAAALGTYWVEYRTHPAGPTDVVTIVDVPSGMGFYALADELGRRRIINRPELLKVLVRLRGVGSELKAGEYELRGSMLPDALVSHLTSGQVVLHPLTIPEGLNLREIAARIEAAGFGSAQAVLDAARAPALRESLGLRDGASLEGYLYPETYSFPKGTKPALVLRSMVDAFKAAYTPDFEARANELEMTRHEVVTLASIIEKETGSGDERALVSAVFHNRLRRGMPLQSDPTVIYGLDVFDGNLTRAHLRKETPYNTYVIRGLPPGPIASPGRESLRAALWPAQSDALYFVSTGEGRHVFNRSLADHERAVDRYQRRGARGRAGG